jgi:nitrite reductase/ring-hydroxylating ferredoxin subunit
LHSLCRLDEIDPETGKEALVQTGSGNRYIALFKVDNQVHAYLNTCPHQGRSLNWAPDQFLLGDDGKLVCPHHGACFDISTGECTSGPCEGASLTRLECVIVNGIVQIPVPI